MFNTKYKNLTFTFSRIFAKSTNKISPRRLVAYAGIYFLFQISHHYTAPRFKI